MPNHDAVAAALARLANGRSPGAAAERTATGTAETTSSAPASVVADATAALTRLSTAAAFVQDGGEQRLSRAIDDARRGGNPAVAERGEAVLAALDRLRAAADGDSLTAEGHRAEHTDDRSVPDHFHHGHATLLTGGGVASER